MNFSEGGVFDTTSRFQIASPASIHPARSPMRGSGVGGVADILGAGAEPPGADGVHPATDSQANPNDRQTTVLGFMDSVWRGRARAACRACALFLYSGRSPRLRQTGTRSTPGQRRGSRKAGRP